MCAAEFRRQLDAAKQAGMYSKEIGGTRVK